MKAKCLAVAVLFGLCSLNVVAQEKKSFTLEDLNFGGTNYRNMVPKTQYHTWWGDELVRFEGKNYFLVDKETGKETQLLDTETVNKITQHRSADNRSFVKDNNLYIVENQGDTAQLTSDGSREIVYGQSVHRNEFGIDGGVFWSPDGQRVAFYRMDQSKVADYPQVNIATRSAAYEPDKYPMAGEQSHDVTVGIYDLKTKKTIYL
ncbi:MAG: DPP IV N-terminal domain-containing protein, partial [Prevotella sp.]|nr:DPP IV N-terminal domain-containing protein [Prevotella sp.]